MNEKALHTLEYDKIKEKLIELADSGRGKRMCRELLPLSDAEDVKRLQEETAAALARLERKGNLSFVGIPEMGDILGRIAVKATLGMGELRRVSDLLTVTVRIKEYGGKSLKEDEEDEDRRDPRRIYFRNASSFLNLSNLPGPRYFAA